MSAYVYTGFALVVVGFISVVVLILIYRRYRANRQAADAENNPPVHPQVAFANIGSGGGVYPQQGNPSSSISGGSPTPQQQQYQQYQPYYQHQHHQQAVLQGVSIQQGAPNMYGNNTTSDSNHYYIPDTPHHSSGGIDAVANQEGGGPRTLHSPRHGGGDYSQSPVYQQPDASYYMSGGGVPQAHIVSSSIQPVGMV